MARLWANYILKVNRAQLKKRKIRKFKEMLSDRSGPPGLSYKEVSTEEMRRIKTQIREEASKETKKEIFRYLVAIAGSIIILWLLYVLITD